jgi:hypothetical protein
MKKILLLAINLFLFHANAQNQIEGVSIEYGVEIQDNTNKIVKIIGEANGKIYTLSVKKNDFFIKIFTAADMKELSSKQIIVPPVKDRDVDFEDIFLLNDKLYVIGSVYDKKTKKFNLVANALSEDGVLSKNNTVLFEAEVEKKSRKGAFYMKQSPDGGALLIMHTSQFNKEEAIKYEVKLFDDQMMQLFTYNEKVVFDDSKKEYEFLIADFDLNVNDDIFLVISEGYRDKKLKERVEKFELHAFKRGNNYQKEVVKIDLKDKEIINCSMMATRDESIHLVGFFSDVREDGRANKELKGIYNVVVDVESKTLKSAKFNEFDMATRIKLIGERRAKKGRDVAPYYNIHSIIEKEEGGLIVLSEYQARVVGQSSGIGPLAITPITYIRNEIIVTSLKLDGSLEWSNVIPKEQAASVSVLSFNLGAVGTSGSFNVGMSMSIPLTELGKGPEYLGAIPIYNDGKLQVIINDNVKNKGITDIEEIKNMGNYNKAVPSLFSFDANGIMSRKDPEEAIKNELVLRPGVFYRKSSREFIIYSSREKSDKLGRLKL